MARILGVDCSSKSIALSLFVDGVLTLYGEVKFGDGDIYSRMHRASKYMTAVSETIGDLDAIYFESAVYIQNKKTVILLAYTLGAALSPLLGDKTLVFPTIPVVWQGEMNPALSKAEKASIDKENPGRSASWLKNRYRQEHKLRGIKKVKTLFGVDVESDDISDAILIGAYGAKHAEKTKDV